jgi:nucleotide-binding universal stress UspA family protein
MIAERKDHCPASPTAADAVQQAIELVKLTGGQLHIVTAYKPQQLTSPVSGVDEYLKSLGSGHLADSLLADLASRATLAGVGVTTHASTSAPADAICEIAVQVKADLIVVGNKGMTGVRRVLGSVPNAVAHQAPCAVLIAFTS